MRKIVDYLRLILFTGGVLLGVQMPGFIEQYGKSLQAHLLESSLSLEEFEKDAERYFDGNLNKLTAHYQNNPDPIIKDGGASISAIYSRNLNLEQAWVGFSKNTYSAYKHVLLEPLTDVKNEVWSNYTYSIVLNQSAIISGLCCGFLLALLIELSGLLISKFLQHLFLPLGKAPSH
ncbi:MAG: DUF2937 family protein [Candidatus Reddybacter sp.]